MHCVLILIAMGLAAADRPREITNSIGMKLVLVPAGEFKAGSANQEKGVGGNECPQHEVRITKPFYMGQYEVTVGQFRSFITATAYKTDAEKEYGQSDIQVFDPKTGGFELAKVSWLKGGLPLTDAPDDHPVVYVSWNDAKAFCRWLSEKEKKSYRLPTEAEWEYACRAGTTTRWYSGDDESGVQEYAWFQDLAKTSPDATQSEPTKEFVGPRPGGQKKANGWGLYDMLGNVAEWCSDWYESGYYWKSPQDDPQGPTQGQYRVIRGGSYRTEVRYCRSARREFGPPVNYGGFAGFRIVRGVQ